MEPPGPFQVQRWGRWRHGPNERAESDAAGSQRRDFLTQSPLAIGQARPQSQWGRGTGRLISLTPVRSLNTTNQAGREVSTSFQWNLVVLRFPPELWWSLASWTPCACSNLWPQMQLAVGTKQNRIKAKLKIILKPNQETDPTVSWKLGHQVAWGERTGLWKTTSLRFLFLALAHMGEAGKHRFWFYDWQLCCLPRSRLLFSILYIKQY